MKQMMSVAIAAVTAVLVLSAVPAASADIKIAIAGPMTGPTAAYGAQFMAGADVAVADINAAGGILGQTVVLEVGDDVADPKQGVSVANKFVSDGVKFVVGHFNSGVTIPASDIYAEAGLLEVSPSATNPLYTERGLWNTFRVCGRDDQQIQVSGDYILKDFAGKKVAIVHDKTTAGKGGADEMKKRLNDAGVTETMFEGVNAGEKDYSAIVSKMKLNGIGVLYYSGAHTEAGLIIRQMREQSMNTVVVGGDSFATSELWAIGGPGTEGTVFTFSPDPRDNLAAKDIVERFRSKGIEPESYTLYTYAAFQVLKQAIEAAKSAEPMKVAEQMRSGMAFQTVLGEFSFDQKGDLTRADYVMFRWSDGNYAQLQ